VRRGEQRGGPAAVRQDPSQPVYHIRLGGTYILLAQFERALEVFQNAARLFPEVDELDYFTGLAARGKGDSELAQSALRKAIARRPDNADAMALLGAILSDRGDAAEAEALLRRAAARDAGHFNAHRDLGALLLRAQRYDEAVTVLRRAAALNDADPEVHYKLYTALTRLGRKEEAAREFAIYQRLSEGQNKQ